VVCTSTSKSLITSWLTRYRVSSPHSSLADLLLPLAVRRAKVGVMIHLAGDYMTDAPSYTSTWWTCLEREKKESLVSLGYHRLCREVVRRCQWVLVCKTEKILKKVLKASAGYTCVITYAV
jgi:hypothetical protein